MKVWTSGILRTDGHHVDMDAEQSVRSIMRCPDREGVAPIAPLNETPRVAEQLDHQPIHERSSPPRADRARDRGGEREARKRGDDNIVPVRSNSRYEPGQPWRSRTGGLEPSPFT